MPRPDDLSTPVPDDLPDGEGWAGVVVEDG